MFRILLAFDRFKVKVGLNREDDERRVELVRREIGKDNILVIKASNSILNLVKFMYDEVHDASLHLRPMPTEM